MLHYHIMKRIQAKNPVVSLVSEVRTLLTTVDMSKFLLKTGAHSVAPTEQRAIYRRGVLRTPA